MTDSSSDLALGIADHFKSAGETEQDRQQRPISMQFSSRLIVSNSFSVHCVGVGESAGPWSLG
jgi:hypothetical protein